MRSTHTFNSVIGTLAIQTQSKQHYKQKKKPMTLVRCDLYMFIVQSHIFLHDRQQFPFLQF